MRIVPTPEQILAKLSPLLPLLFQAIESSIVRTRDFFDNGNAGKVDLALAPNLVRFYAKQYFKEKGQEVEANEVVGMDPLANNGLLLRFGKYCIRILKSDHGDLPTPGHSRTKQNFYQQMLPFGMPEPFGKSLAETLNLIVLWNVDARYGFQGLNLACPKWGDNRKNSVEAYWQVPVPYLVCDISAFTLPSVEISIAEDLPLVFKRSMVEEESNNG